MQKTVIVKESWLKEGEFPPERGSADHPRLNSKGQIELEIFYIEANRVKVVVSDDEMRWSLLIDGQDCGGWTRAEANGWSAESAVGPPFFKTYPMEKFDSGMATLYRGVFDLETSQRRKEESGEKTGND